MSILVRYVQGRDQRYYLDIEKEDLPGAFIDRLEHVDEKGMVGSIQLWTGARRNTATSFVYKGLTVTHFANGQKFLISGSQ